MKNWEKTIGIMICANSLLLLTNPIRAQITSEGGYLIKGSFNGVQSGIITMRSLGSNKVEDSAKVINGKFTLNGNIGLPEQKLFQITPGIWSFPAFVEPGNLRFIIDTAGAQHTGKIGKGGFALIWQIGEKGSEMADVYNRYLEASRAMKVRKLVFSLQDSLHKIQGNENVTSCIHSTIDSIVNITKYKQKMFMEKYVEGHPASVAGVFLLTDYYRNSHLGHKSSRAYLASMLKKFTGEAKGSIYYKGLTKENDALAKSSAHEVAPDFTLLMRDSSDFTLSSLRGNYVLLDFWASWCGPCRRAIPHWKKVNAKYIKKGLKIVSVSGDRNWNDWLMALDVEQMSWTQVVDDFSEKDQSGARVINLYPSPGIPFYVLIDKVGIIVLSTGDEAKMSAKIDQLLK